MGPFPGIPVSKKDYGAKMFKKMATLGTVVLLLAAIAGAQARQAAGTRSNDIEIEACLVELIEEAQIPAEMPGKIIAFPAKSGDKVDINTLLVQMDETEAKMQLTLAETELKAAKRQAEDDINITYAKASKDLAYAELRKNFQINRKSPGTIPEMEIDRAKLALTRSELQILQAILEQEVAGLTAEAKTSQVDAAKMSLERRQIKSLYPGEIIEIHKHVGEWVSAGEPLLRIVRLDKLRVTGMLEDKNHLPQDIDGRPVVVTVEFPGNRTEKFTGLITFASPIVRIGGTYVVEAEVTNRQERGHWLLRPGKQVKMSIQLGSASLAGAN